MNLVQPQGYLDEGSRIDGDPAGFLGVNERLHPAQLPPGYLARGKNTRLRNGKIQTRNGISILRCGPTDGKTPWTQIYDNGVMEFYDNVDGQKWLIVAADAGVYRTRPNNVAEAMTLPDGVTLSATTFKRFVRAKNCLLLFRGVDDDVLVCTSTDEGFKAITQTIAGDGTEAIPNSDFALYFANRVLVTTDRDNVAVSDLGDYTRYVPIIATFKINEGDFDELVAISDYAATTLIFLKDHSVWSVQNVYGDLSEAIGPRAVTRQFGCLAPDSVVRMGSDLFWWSERGLTSLGLTTQNEVQARNESLTDDLPFTMGRLNRLYQSKIKCAEDDGYLYCAVPLDDAVKLGADNVAATDTYDTLGTDSLYYKRITGLTGGLTYRYIQGAEDYYLDNNGTSVAGGCDFVAGTTYVDLYSEQTISGTTVTAELRVVAEVGVLNAVLVYDKNRNAWAGVDESDALWIRGWFKFEFMGEQRLGFAGGDGFLHLYEDGLEDELLQTGLTPYLDVLVFAAPTAGRKIQVNSGTNVVAANVSDNTSTHWGTSTLALARTNLWEDATVPTHGYNGTASPWSAPNTTPAQIAWGVRFLATNGAVPAVNIDDVARTETGFYGSSSWAFLDFHGTSEILGTAIDFKFTTRGYLCADPDLKRYSVVVLQCSMWNPNYTISTQVPGAGTLKAWRSSQTLSRTGRGTALNTSTWDSSNASDDHGAPGRSDYSVVLPATGMNLDPTGVNFELHQEVCERVPVDQSGHLMQLVFESTTGRVEVNSAIMESLMGDRQAGTKIA